MIHIISTYLRKMRQNATMRGSESFTMQAHGCRCMSMHGHACAHILSFSAFFSIEHVELPKR